MIAENKPRKVRTRDLSKAITLRPAEVFQLYGIPQSTLNDLALHCDPTKRVPSTLIPGRCGRRGIRLFNHDQLRAFLARHDA